MRKEKNLFVFRSAVSLVLMVVMIVCIMPLMGRAELETVNVQAKLYVTDKDGTHTFSPEYECMEADDIDPLGHFAILGAVMGSSVVDDISSYEVESGDLDFVYEHDDTYLTAEESEWHLIDDKDKAIDGVKRDGKILKGAILVQTSRDRMNWTDVQYTTNAFSDTPIRTDAIYTTKDVQLLSGCYYRVVVAYTLRKVAEEKKILFVPANEYEYRKVTEVYEFYAISQTGDNSTVVSDQTHSRGEKVRVENFEGYAGAKETIKKNDPHYGWNLGHFFVSGYTDKQTNSNGDMVFLKNVGDKVTLWFNLEHNINELNGDKNLTITADTEAYDEYFETERTNFGKGTLIVRYTDYNGNKTKPQIYTNYLEANVTVGADTKVQLFEEGDYEVALDYEVTDNKLIDSVAHYRIFFQFSVRNGNCMVYPFDVADGTELTNCSMTDNGFKLDLAKSRYLKVNVKREVLTDSVDGLMEDTRFNGPAKDGAEYTQDGIYTITVTNEYTKQFTTKKIYVGTNKVLKAYMTTGLSIPEINNLVAEGASIDDKGVITLATDGQEDEHKEIVIPDNPVEGQKQNDMKLMYIGVAVILLAITFVVVLAYRRKKRNAKKGECGK